VERDLLWEKGLPDRHPGAGGDRRRGRERERDDPDDRQERDQHDQDDPDRPEGVLAASPFHQLPGLPSAMRTANQRTNTKAIRSTQRKIRTETADPSPRLSREISWLKPRIETDSVSWAPRVMMKIVSKTRKASSVRN